MVVLSFLSPFSDTSSYRCIHLHPSKSILKQESCNSAGRIVQDYRIPRTGTIFPVMWISFCISQSKKCRNRTTSLRPSKVPASETSRPRIPNIKRLTGSILSPVSPPGQFLHPSVELTGSLDKPDPCACLGRKSPKGFSSSK